jgi:hypothetical protein
VEKAAAILSRRIRESRAWLVHRREKYGTYAAATRVKDPEFTEAIHLNKWVS